MKILVIGFILGWVTNIICYEYQYFEHYDLTIDASDKGYTWDKNKDGITEITAYVRANETKVLKYINFKPELWTCRFVFMHEKCLIKSLLRTAIPVKDRPKRKSK